MKYKIVNTFPNAFFINKKAPFISIYQDTSKNSKDFKHDAIVFKNLIKYVKTSLEEKYSKKEITPLLNLFETIEKESTFWSHTFDGIALFSTLDECIIYNLKKPVKTLAVVADSFHIKPLIQYYEFVQTYQFLDIDGKSFQILEGNPYSLEKIELNDDIQTTMDELLGTEYSESYLTRGTYSGTGKSIFHGHGGSNEEIEIDLERFFRRVDSIVYDNISKDSKLPMILIAPAEHHSLYMKISNNIYLEPNAIAGTYESLGKEEIIKRTHAYAKVIFRNKIKLLINQYHKLRTIEKSSDQLIEIISAAVDGRVDTLFIQENEIIPGKIDTINKKIITDTLTNPAVDDILDDLAQFTLEKGGNVFILSKDEMPTNSVVASIYRY